MRPLTDKTNSDSASKSAENSAGFTPLLAAESMKNQAGEESVSPPAVTSKKCEKDVELVVNDGVVVKIRVHCCCGEITEIDCRYSE